MIETVDPLENTFEQNKHLLQQVVKDIETITGLEKPTNVILDPILALTSSHESGAESIYEPTTDTQRVFFTARYRGSQDKENQGYSQDEVFHEATHGFVDKHNDFVRGILIQFNKVNEITQKSDKEILFNKALGAIFLQEAIGYFMGVQMGTINKKSSVTNMFKSLSNQSDAMDIILGDMILDGSLVNPSNASAQNLMRSAYVLGGGLGLLLGLATEKVDYQKFFKINPQELARIALAEIKNARDNTETANAIIKKINA